MQRLQHTVQILLTALTSFHFDCTQVLSFFLQTVDLCSHLHLAQRSCAELCSCVGSSKAAFPEQHLTSGGQTLFLGTCHQYIIKIQSTTGSCLGVSSAIYQK